MRDKGNMWLNHPRSSTENIKGVKDFMRNAMVNYAVGTKINCPCSICDSRAWWEGDDVYNHLMCNGPSLIATRWIYDVSNSKDSTETMDFE